MARAFRTLLVANRGEIAARIVRTARSLGYATVAVHSDADVDAAHVRMADRAVRIGPSAPSHSYLSTTAVLDAAARTGADAIHPGYGFLAENADFARASIEAGLVFVGPPPDVIRTMGDKSAAKQAVRAAGIECVPGFDGDVQDDASMMRAATELGFPLLVKAIAGGGGRGMRRVDDPTQLAAALASARAEAHAGFGDARLMLESLVENARHVEVQVLADGQGNVIHLGERDCSAQRRHQKVVEEAPSPAVDESLRAALGAAAVRVARAVGYVNAGTIELLLGPDRRFWFLEMNTRLQVEHPITEAITGLDLVELQLRVAAGEPLPLGQEQVRLRGHAVEARLCAEDPWAGFEPRPGRVLVFRPDIGEGLRCDAGVRDDDVVTADYDPLLAKLVSHAPDRAQALRRLARGLERTGVLGIETNRGWLARLIEHPRFAAGEVTTTFVERDLVLDPPRPTDSLIALAAALWSEGPDRIAPDPWRNSGDAQFRLELRVGGRARTLRLTPGPDRTCRVAHAGRVTEVALLAADPPAVRARIAGVEHCAFAAWDERGLFVQLGLEHAHCEEIEPGAVAVAARAADEIVAPSAGRVTGVAVRDGDRVKSGALAVRLEAMKIEASLTFERDGVVAAVRVAPGEQVVAGQSLVVLHAADPDEHAPS